MKLRTEESTRTIKVTRGEDVAIFEVNILDPQKISDLIRKHTPPKVWVGNTSEELPLNYVAMHIDRVIHTIKSWDITDQKGDPIECNAENKKKIYLLNPGIINEVLAETAKLADDKLEIEKDEIKNL